MGTVYDAGIEPDPADARNVLAFVLCPPAAFIGGSGDDDLEELASLIAPVKQAAVQRWCSLCRARSAN
jgi:hypothetical protein